MDYLLIMADRKLCASGERFIPLSPFAFRYFTHTNYVKLPTPQCGCEPTPYCVLYTTPWCRYMTTIWCG